MDTEAKDSPGEGRWEAGAEPSLVCTGLSPTPGGRVTLPPPFWVKHQVPVRSYRPCHSQGAGNTLGKKM